MLHLVYGNLRALSKTQIRAWARFAYAERDLFYFALPATFFVVFGALFLAAGHNAFITFSCVALPLLLFLLFGRFIYDVRGLDQFLRLRGGRFSRSQRLSKWVDRALKRLRTPLNHHQRYITSTFGLDVTALLMLAAVLFERFFGKPNSSFMLLIGMWVSFEFMRWRWQARPSFFWLDLLSFGNLDRFLSKTLETCFLLAAFMGSVSYVVARSFEHALIVGLTPVLSTFVLLTAGPLSSLYLRLIFLASIAFTFVLLDYHPIFPE